MRDGKKWRFFWIRFYLQLSSSFSSYSVLLFLYSWTLFSPFEISVEMEVRDLNTLLISFTPNTCDVIGSQENMFLQSNYFNLLFIPTLFSTKAFVLSSQNYWPPLERAFPHLQHGRPLTKYFNFYHVAAIRFSNQNQAQSRLQCVSGIWTSWTFFVLKSWTW